MAIQIFEELFARRGHRYLVIEPELGRRSQFREISHRRTKYADMGRVRFRPPLQRRKALPPALAVGFLADRAIPAKHAHVAIGIAADAKSLIAKEIHSFAQHWLDIVEIHLALGLFGVAPVLPGPDQAQIVMRDDADARAVPREARRAARVHRA